MPLWYFSDIAREIVYYDRGRDALWGALGLLGLKAGDVILVPAYLCSAVLQPIKKRRLRFKFYQIQKDMSANLKDLAEKICPETKAILVIHYFGFPQPVSGINRICRERNLFLIEDCAHVLVSKVDGRHLGSFGDAAVFSFKKTLKFLPGRGAALLIHSRRPNRTLQGAVNMRRSVSILSEVEGLINNPQSDPRRFRDRQSVSGAHKNFYQGIEYFVLQQKALRFLIDRIIRLTDFLRLRPNSRIREEYLDKMTRLDLTGIVARCRENFISMLDNIKGCKDLVPVFPSLPPEVCPMGFPVFVNDRDSMFRKLLRSGLRPFILWEFLPKEVKRRLFKDADYICRHILIFPVDDFINIKNLYDNGAHLRLKP